MSKVLCGQISSRAGAAEHDHQDARSEKGSSDHRDLPKFDCIAVINIRLDFEAHDTSQRSPCGRACAQGWTFRA
jgi:hypothetical protein